MALGPLADSYGYKAYWHKFAGQALPYRLLYPYNYNPANSYPLVVYLPGDGAYATGGYHNTGQVTNGGFGNTYFTAGEDGLTYSQLAQDYPCFVLALLYPTRQAAYSTPASTQSWMNTDSSYHRQNDVSESEFKGYIGKTETLKIPNTYYTHAAVLRYIDESPNSWFVNAAISLIRKLSTSLFSLYKLSDFAEKILTADAAGDVTLFSGSDGVNAGGQFTAATFNTTPLTGEEVGMILRVTSGVNAGDYTITSITDPFHLVHDGSFSESGFSWVIVSTAIQKLSIDYDKIYLIGYSRGAAQQIGFLTAGRQLFAGALLADAYPAGLFSNTWRSLWGTTDSTRLTSIGRRLMQDILHIPTLTYVALDEAGDYFDEVTKWGHEFRALEGAANSYLAGVNSGPHDLSYLLNDTHTFDTSITNQLQYFGTTTGGNYKTAIEWLFSLSKPSSVAQENHPSGFLFGQHPGSVMAGDQEGYYAHNPTLAYVGTDDSEWPYNDNAPVCCLHHDGYRDTPAGSMMVYEVVDKNCDTILVFDGREVRITNEQVSGDTYKLVWDKGTAFEQEFTTAGQTKTLKTNSGKYTLTYLGQVSGYKNQRFRMTGPIKTGVLAL